MRHISFFEHYTEYKVPIYNARLNGLTLAILVAMTILDAANAIEALETMYLLVIAGSLYHAYKVHQLYVFCYIEERMHPYKYTYISFWRSLRYNINSDDCSGFKEFVKDKINYGIYHSMSVLCFAHYCATSYFHYVS